LGIKDSKRCEIDEGGKRATGEEVSKTPADGYKVKAARLNGCGESWEKVTAACTRLGLRCAMPVAEKRLFTAFGEL